MSCGVGLRCGLDSVLLWLWYRSAALALILPVVWELPCHGWSPKKTKKKKKVLLWGSGLRILLQQCGSLWRHGFSPHGFRRSGVKDPALLQLWLRLSPWLGNVHMLWVQPFGKNACTLVPPAALFPIAKTRKHPKCPSPEEWIKKMWYIHAMEYYSATTRMK